MVYTITCNPSLDYGVTVENFQMGHTNRTVTEQMNVGGKGINVSIVLKHLGIPTKILGFTAGFIGREIEKRIKEQEIEAEWIRLPQGDSRINVKLLSKEGTEINGQGPAISKREVQELEEKLSVLTKEDVLVLAGNVQKSLGQTFYADIMKKLKDRQIRTVVDASGELLKAVLPYHPFLIKPNQDELEGLFQVKMSTKEEMFAYAKQLQEMGACNVLISLGGNGALLLTEHGEQMQLDAPKGEVRNAVGAGDSMVAGFLAGYMEHASYEEAFQMAVAAGSASAFSEHLATRAEIEQILPLLLDSYQIQ